MNKKEETQNIIDYDELETKLTQKIDRIIRENHELRFENEIDICPSIKLEKKLKNFSNKKKSLNNLSLSDNDIGFPKYQVLISVKGLNSEKEASNLLDHLFNHDFLSRLFLTKKIDEKLKQLEKKGEVFYKDGKYFSNKLKGKLLN